MNTVHTAIVTLAILSARANAQCGDSDMYSPDPESSDYNPLHPDADYDGDGIPNKDDDDIDGDGVNNGCDKVLSPPPRNIGDPHRCQPWEPCWDDGEDGLPLSDCFGMGPDCDTDGDGIPNRDDRDDDGDGVDDINDPDHPSYDPTHPNSDPDCDGSPNHEDEDDDGDGCPDDQDSSSCDPSEDGGCGDDDNKNDAPRPDDRPTDDNPEDDPPDRPDPPDPPIPPIIPPRIPDPPRPEPPAPEDPPDDDACCLAMTTRLDNLLIFAEDESELNRNRNDLIDVTNTWLDALYNGLVDDDFSVFNTLNYAVYDIRAYLSSMHAMMDTDLDYQHDITWYLEQLYLMEYLGTGDPGGYTSPGYGTNYQPTSPSGAIARLQGTHETAMAESDQVFGLPDLDKYADDDEAPIFEFNMAFASYFNINMQTLYVDFTPFTPVRNLAHSAIMILVVLNGIFIVWEELRKS